MAPEPDDELPVAPIDSPDKPKPSRPPKGSPEAKAWGQEMAARRRAKIAERKAAAAEPIRTGGQNAPTVGPPSAAELKGLASELADSCRDLGALVGPLAPTPGLYMMETADTFASAVTRAAEHNPKLLAYLQRSSGYTAYLAIGSWLAGLGVATWAEASGGQVPMTIAQRWEIDRMYLATHEIAEPGHMEEEIEDGEGAFGVVSVPAPSFLGGDQPTPTGAVAAG